MDSKKGVRATTTKFFLDALEEEKSGASNLLQIASQIEDAVLDLYKSESAREYREAINFLKMRLKGN